MGRKRKAVPAAADQRSDLHRLMGLLARRGSHILASDLAGGSAVIPVVADGTLGEDVIGLVPESTLAEALSRGWAAPVEGDERTPARIRITRAGREALRAERARLAAQRAGRPLAMPASSPMPVTNPAESPLSWLRSRRDGDGKPILSEAQADAGERLRSDLTLAGLTPRVTMSWTGIPGPGSGRTGAPTPAASLAEHTIAARQRVTRALEAVGPEHAGILIDVCGHLRGLDEIAGAEGWPRRSARLVLQHALTALARHYGLIAPEPVERTLAERLRHWGTADYRPTLARWRGAAQE
jgi:hypothetical protein